MNNWSWTKRTRWLDAVKSYEKTTDEKPQRLQVVRKYFRFDRIVIVQKLDQFIGSEMNENLVLTCNVK